MAKPNKPKSPPVGVPKTRNNGPIIGGALAVVAVLVLVAVILTVTNDSGSEEDVSGAELIQQQSVAVTGTPLPQAPEGDGQADPAVGATAPDIVGKNFEGQPVEIKNDGRPKVVMFFAHWCPHCQRELPELSQFINQNKSKYPVDYYAVNTSVNRARDNYPPSDWFQQESFTAPVLADSSQGSAATAYGIGGFPFITYLDAQNKVVARTSGELPVSTFEANVSRLSSQTPAPAASGPTGPASNPAG